MKHKLFYLKALMAILLLLGLDQWTKQLAVTHLYNKEPLEIIPGVFEFQYLRNAGAAFGIFQNKQAFFLIVTLVVVAFLFYLVIKMPEEKKFFLLRIDLILLIAGALGNFIDRALQQYVTDFFYFKLIDFPIFNVADCYVVISVFVLAFMLLFVYKEEDLDEIFSCLKGGRKD